MHVVLFEPEIPPNTGNVGRLCAATGVCLHLIEPLGFRMEDRDFKRAGMDYWQHVRWFKWPHWKAFKAQIERGSTLWFIESGGPRNYADVSFLPQDYLIFGRESAGLPMELIEDNKEHWVRIPMMHKQARSLNLSNAVSIVLYEALRQQSFPNAI